MSGNIAGKVWNSLAAAIQSANELEIDYKLESARQSLELFRASLKTLITAVEELSMAGQHHVSESIKNECRDLVQLFLYEDEHVE